MQDFIHLHVHTQYSLLDGQASVARLVDKAIGDGMKGIAVTDHGNMFGIKEFFNYVNKKNGGPKGEIKDLKKRMAGIESGKIEVDDKDAELADCRTKMAEAEAKLFKPIFGCEMYVARRGDMHLRDGKQDQSGWHLIVLAKNETGYHNLIKLVSRSWTEGYYMRPRTDHSELEKYHEGLIVCSACIGGEVPRKILSGNIAAAEEAVQWFKNLFGDDYYLEIQRHRATVARANHETYGLQQQVNAEILRIAQKYNVKVVATNDVHFVDEENAEAHDRLICLSTGKDLDDPTRMLYTKQEWMKTRAEMNELFADVPEALSNTLEVLDKVEVYSIDHSPIMPFFPIPESFGTEEEYRSRITEQQLYDEFTTDENGKNPLPPAEGEEKIKRLGGYEKLYRIKFEADYLAELSYEGARRCYGDPLPEEVHERVKFELHIMKTMGFPGYFLIVQDFINSARDELGVMVGPGRGSAAGSVVAYCLGITKIDPIKYDLLFERFLNPDRISLPDIDTDFDDDGRGRVLEWVEDKYGHDKVAHIITYGTMATKNSIKDVARVEKLPLETANRLCKAIPDRLPDDLKMNLNNAIKSVPELREAEVSSDPKLSNTIKYARMLEGNIRGTGIHACGTIICRDAISDWVPVSTADDKDNPGHKLLATQYDGHVIEETGLIKMDFLGLKTLSILKEAVENIRITDGKEVDLDTIPIDDELTYKLYQEGRTIGTFQFESAGMQKYLRELKPTVFEDLIAMNALYRPGPMDYIPSFIARKNGSEEIKYDIPCMEKYLKDTYGITVYQEQVMLLSRQLANFTRGESDALRKAMGKKKKAIVDAMKPKFIAGGQKNGHDPKVLEKIWSDWEKFASYAFNKSHATCYSWVAYQTAYLKAHYPAEFMAGNMSRNLDNITEITKLMDECKAMNISTLEPDVNESYLKFSVNKKGDIRFGLAAIKGVGEGAAQNIIAERENGGPYKDIFDFVQRVSLSACNRKCMENLALSGAFDGLPGIKREDFFAKNSRNESFVEILMRYGSKYQTDKQVAVNSLFGGDNMVEIARPEIPEAEQWSDLERLEKERDLVGIYLSAHPLDEYSVVLENVCNTQMAELENKENLKGREITMGGIVTEVRRGTTKKGNPYGIAKIEDYSGSAEIPFFGSDWVTYQGYLGERTFLFIKARCQPKQWQQGELELKITSMELLPDVKEQLIQKLTITLPLSALDGTLVSDLTEMIEAHPGETELYFRVIDAETNLTVDLVSRPVKLSVGRELINYIKEAPELDFRIN